MSIFKTFTLIILFISTCIFQNFAQDLIENTRAGIDPSIIDENNTYTTLIFDNIDKYWIANEATIMDVFETSEVSVTTDDAYNRYVSDYVVLDLKKSELEYVYKLQPEDLLMLIPVTSDKYIELALTKTEVSGTFTSKCLHYQGVVNDASGSLAAITFTNDQISVMIGDSGGNYIVNKAVDFDNSYVLYNDRNLNFREGLQCGTPNSDYGTTASIERSNEGSSCVSIYFECDYSTFQTYDANEDEVIFKVESTFNQVQLIYAEEEITVEIADIFVHTSEDPEYEDTILISMLDKFRDRIKNNFRGNIAQYITTKNIGGGWGYVGGKHSITDLGGPNEQSPFPDYSRDIYLVAHEMGHNLGSPHTHACQWGPDGNQALDNCHNTEGGCNPGPTPTNGGTIMSYCVLNSNIGVNFANRFGEEPGNLMRQNVQSFSCQKRGCTSPYACTYNPYAEIDDGTCVFDYDASLFDNNPWVTDVVYPENCESTGFELYNINGNGYLYVISVDSNYLYFENPLGVNIKDRIDFNGKAYYNLTDLNLVAISCACQPNDCEPQPCNTNPCSDGGEQQWNSSTCACEIIEATITGCTDPVACNYDESANCPDNSLCLYEPDCNNCDEVEVYTDYPWLLELTDINNCNFEKVTVYTIDYHTFIYAVFADEGVLFNEDGSIWAQDNGDYYFPNYFLSIGYYEKSSTECCPTQSCNNTGTFFFDDCNGVSYYFIETTDGEIFDPYLTQEDYDRIFPNDNIDGVVVDFDFTINNDIENNCDRQPVDITCIEFADLICGSNTGTFYFDDCGDQIYYFIETADGDIFDPYLSEEDINQIFVDGIVEGVQISFDYCYNFIDNPCDIQPIDISNPVVIDAPANPPIFENFPWLSDFVDLNNCDGTTIEVYDYSGFDFVNISINGIGKIYYNGQLQCSDEDYLGFTCVEIYGFDVPVQSWSCGNQANKLNNLELNEKKIESPSIQLKQKEISFNVFPNPSEGFISIDFKDTDIQNTNLNVYNMNGKKVFTDKLKSVTGNIISFDLSNLSKGIYMMEISNEQITNTKKLIIN